MMTKRIPETHKWLMERGWVRVADRLFGNRVQAQWTHPRKGDKTFNTAMAEYIEIKEMGATK